MKKEKQCEHKWLPNGITKREVWCSTDIGRDVKYGEVVYASAVCEKCGEIKIKKED